MQACNSIFVAVEIEFLLSKYLVKCCLWRNKFIKTWPLPCQEGSWGNRGKLVGKLGEMGVIKQQPGKVSGSEANLDYRSPIP